MWSLSLPDSSGRHIIFGLNCPCEAWHSGRYEVERGEDLLVLLPHVHHHPRLGGRQHFPPFPRLLSTVVPQDGDTRGDCSRLGGGGSESQGNCWSSGSSCRGGACWARCVQHWCPGQVHHRVELASLLGKVSIFLKRYQSCDSFDQHVGSTWHW